MFTTQRTLIQFTSSRMPLQQPFSQVFAAVRVISRSTNVDNCVLRCKLL